MKYFKLRSIWLYFLVIICFFLLYPMYASARMIRGEKSPVEMLTMQGYYIRNQEEISNLRIKLVSFDWGGVLSIKSIRGEIVKLLKELGKRGIRMVIVSEGDRDKIEAELNDGSWGEDFNWRQYFEDIRCGEDKRGILEEVAQGLDKNKVIHFDDNPRQIENVGYKFSVIAVVGRTLLDSEYERLAQILFRETSSPAIISHLGIGIDNILRKILNIQEQ